VAFWTERVNPQRVVLEITVDRVLGNLWFRSPVRGTLER
jgi:hypothetical protein